MANIGNVLPSLIQQFMWNGSAVANGSLYSYAAGTSTPQATYTDATLGTPNANPVVLDANGMAPQIWTSSSAYKFVLKNSSGVTLWTVDNVQYVDNGYITSAMIAAGAIGSTQLAAGAVGSTQLAAGGVGTTQLAGRGVDSTKIKNLLQVVFKNKRDNDFSAAIVGVPQWPWSAPTKLTSPGSLTAACTLAKYSPNGEFLAVATSASPYLVVYQRAGTTYNAISGITTPTAAIYDMDWSPCGSFLAVGFGTSPYYIVYQRSGSSFTAATVPSLSGTPNQVRSIKFSPNGDYLAVTNRHNSPLSFSFNLFQLSGTTFTDITSGSGIGTTNITDTFMAWSPDSSMFLVSDTTHASGLLIYQRTANTFSAVTEPTPGASPLFASFSPDGSFLAIAINGSPYINLYTISGTSFSALSNPGTLPPANLNGMAWSLGAGYLALGHGTSPYHIIYSISGSTFTGMAALTTTPDAAVNGLDFSPTTKYLALAVNGSAYLNVYQTASAIGSNSILYCSGLSDV